MSRNLSKIPFDAPILFNTKSLSADNSLQMQHVYNIQSAGRMHPVSADVLQWLWCVNVSVGACAFPTTLPEWRCNHLEEET